MDKNTAIFLLIQLIGLSVYMMGYFDGKAAGRRERK